MNIRRFAARTSREAMARVREAFGDDAIVLHTQPCDEGVEVVAMSPDDVQSVAQASARAPRVSFAPARPEAAAPGAVDEVRPASKLGKAGGVAPERRAEVQGDVDLLSMTTLSFQDYVRQRMNKRRRSNGDSLFAPSEAAPLAAPASVPARDEPPRTARSAAPPKPEPLRTEPVRVEPTLTPADRPVVPQAAARPASKPALLPPTPLPERPAVQPMTRIEAPAALPRPTPEMHSDAGPREQEALLRELRSMKGMIEERFGALSFMDGLQRDPRRAQLAQRLLDAGFSMGVIKALSARLPAAVSDEVPWVALELERQLRTSALEEEGGVYALVGPTGVGKTGCVAKIAAAFVARHGAAQLGLVTLDAHRPSGHDSLRAHGRALGVPVHVAHDRASLEDLLQLLGGKKLVLIDTAGIAPRGGSAADLLHTVGGPGIRRLLVVAATSQGESIEDCVGAFGMSSLHGVLLTKLDEAVKLGPALDVLIRHHIKLYGTSHGQRLAEDWHRADAKRLLQRALRAQPASAWRADSTQLGLLFKPVPGDMPAVAQDGLHRVPKDAPTPQAAPNLGPRATAFLAQAH